MNASDVYQYCEIHDTGVVLTNLETLSERIWEHTIIDFCHAQENSAQRLATPKTSEQ